MYANLITETGFSAVEHQISLSWRKKNQIIKISNFYQLYYILFHEVSSEVQKLKRHKPEELSMGSIKKKRTISSAETIIIKKSMAN